ncbi:MAG: cob(I)yrinic acid a,c-diamide adenosyltransferase [Kiritimatiellae bacterium]|nr:cob(I)yrinic acid a,c-diamide adenosyltransferase [Kiritimatiellia bacterium]
MSITTRTGDDGTTRLTTGEKVSKDIARMEAVGDVDELVSVLGIAACHVQGPGIGDSLVGIQRTLLAITSALASSNGGPADRWPVTDAMLKDLDAKCAALEQSVEMPADFVVPGGCLASAHLDHARAVARRCERRIVGLVRKGDIPDRGLIAWINRLSDYLWLLARAEAR